MAAIYVAYLRVSTQGQGRSGLGLEAQRQAVNSAAHGASIVAEFVEVESGRRADRPVLAQALAAARIHRAALIVAKVDRLTRSLAFLSKLIEAGVEVRFCDLPEIDGPTGRFMLQQMAAVAELEAGLIGKRTRDALAAAKARGQTLGGRRAGQCLTPTMQAGGRKVVADRAAARAADLAPIILAEQARGVTSLKGLARALNRQGIPTATGGRYWHTVQVQRILARLNANQS